MIFRDPQADVSQERRFRSGTDAFTFAKDGEYYMARVVASAERVVELFHALAEHLPPAVDIVIDDLRSGHSWKGETVALPDARDAIARLKDPLARYGGVEMALYTYDDQLTINPSLELFVYARTDRWLYLLEGKGLEQRDQVHSKSWTTSDQHFPAAPELVTAVESAVQRLALTQA